MKIGIDARWIFRELSGIGSYTRELIRHLVRLEHDSDPHSGREFVIYFSDSSLRDRTVAETELDRAPNFSTRLLPFGLFSVRNQLCLPSLLKKDALDVFHSPNYMIPLRAFSRGKPGHIRCVTTIHDLIPLMFPGYTPRAWKRRFFPLYRLLMHAIARCSDLVLTVSRCSRDDVIRCLRLPPERVTAIPLGVLPKFQPRAETEAAVTNGAEFSQDLASGKSGGGRTILWVGRPDPYKNLVGLIEAFAVLRKKFHLPAELRIAGPKDRRYPEAEQRAAVLGIENAVTWLGYLSDDDLLGEYQSANLLVQPSWYEGFGLPVLEAFACGLPVICSPRGSLPETAGNAALFVQPQDIIGLAESMRRVLTDSRLARELSALGLRQARKFNWETTARLTLEAYRKTVEL